MQTTKTTSELGGETKEEKGQLVLLDHGNSILKVVASADAYFTTRSALLERPSKS